MWLQLVFALYPLVLAALAGFLLLAPRPASPSERLLVVASSGSVVLLAYLAGTWAYTSTHLRVVMVAVWGVAALRTRWRLAPVPWGSTSVKRSRSAIPVLLLFTSLIALVLGARREANDPFEARFPLAGGAYWVIQGGDGLITNPFHSWGGTPTALDIVKLNALGNRAAGVAPRMLSAYAIFGEPVFSPCAGSVQRARDDLPDNPPGQPDPANPSGNHVVLNCGETEVSLGHFMRGSVTVAAGETVEAGQEIARVGNSGHTLEPHLHIHATRGGAARPLRFDGRTLVLNSRMRVPSTGDESGDDTSR